VGLPGRMTLSRQIDLPPIDSTKVAKVIRFEARNWNGLFYGRG
jgi:hypothetical protein